jgi:hypothetical protein
MDPFDKSRCSFPVPLFESEDAEREWAASLTPEQSLELLHWMQVYRWGESAVNAPMDRSAIQVLTMEEFRKAKEQEGREEDEWRIAHGLPRRYTREESSEGGRP